MRRVTVPAALADRPFTVADAAAHGVTGDQLRSPAWRQVFRTVWVAANVPDTRQLRLAAARLILPERAVACGLTAAWLWGVDVRRLDDFDVHVSFAKGERIRKRRGLEVCQETLAAEDVCVVQGLHITTPLRTVFDCLRWLRGAERLVVADALTHTGQVTLSELRGYFASKRRLRNLRRGEALLDLVEPKSESPMETRLRVLLIEWQLPRPEAQWKVYDRAGNHVGRLDLAYPGVSLAVEYDGAEHWKQRREDDRRRDAIRALDWEVQVYSADDIFLTPEATVAAVARALRTRAA